MQNVQHNEVFIEFSDNTLLAQLCGEFDRHLALIENGLFVQIARRGNQLIIAGDAHICAQAAQILERLYERLKQGRDVTSEHIESALALLNSDAADTAADTNVQSIYEIQTRKKRIEPRTATQRIYTKSLFDSDLSFGIGPAGTGKTYLAVAVGVNMLMNGVVERIVLSRPAIEAGERLGFLPGDMKEKVDPFMQPIYDALGDFMPTKQYTKLIEDKRIEIAPLAFMRGRTLSNAFIVLDEAQNTTNMQMKMFLTRLGKGSRMVVTGDTSQIDLPKGTQSGLKQAERLLKKIPSVSFTYFSASDVVRHTLVAQIIKAYEADRPLPAK